MDQAQHEECRDLVARLFALLTAKFEDAAAIAAAAQARDRSPSDLDRTLADLASLHDETATLVAAADRLLR